MQHPPLRLRDDDAQQFDILRVGHSAGGEAFDPPALREAPFIEPFCPRTKLYKYLFLN